MKRTLLAAVLIAGAGCTSRHPELPRSWSGVHNGMTRQEVYTLVGRPAWGAPEQRSPNGARTFAWEHWQHEIGPGKYAGLEVSYDSNDRVISVGHTTSGASRQ